MPKFKISWTALSLWVTVLVVFFGALTINYRGSTKIDHRQIAPKSNQNSDQSVETRSRSKITFLDALQIAEVAVHGKAYSLEQETESGKPVIEVGIDGKEIFVDAERGEIVLIDDLRQKGDREDMEELTKSLKLQKLATIPIQAALQAGERFAGGQAHSVNLENEHGSVVYVVVVELQKVFIDAGNGQILSKSAVEHTEENGELQINSSIQISSPDRDQ
jgi:uncharacterized membrane protein YkoI